LCADIGSNYQPHFAGQMLMQGKRDTTSRPALPFCDCDCHYSQWIIIIGEISPLILLTETSIQFHNKEHMFGVNVMFIYF